MDWKEFFKPDKKKGVTFIILFVVGSLIAFLIWSNFGPGPGIGLPLPFVYHGISELGKGGTQFSILTLLIDIIFWYLVTCTSAYFYNKSKK